jgi:hypothetical protein
MNTSISNHNGLTSESVEKILSENGFESKNLSVNALGYRKTGYGHWKLTCEIANQDNWRENVDLSVTTTDSNLIDDWGEDEQYFQDDNSGHWFSSNQEVMERAFDYILRSESNQETLAEWLLNKENE